MVLRVALRLHLGSRREVTMMFHDRMKTVLVVDDEPAIRDLLQEIASQYECRVLQAEHGKAAWRIAQTEPVDLLITDLVMPEQEGIETIQQFRRAYPTLKVIAISGSMDELYLRMARLLGADAALAKPLPMQTISTLIGQFLGCPACLATN
jgi:CheY-like chemotaxis protein